MCSKNFKSVFDKNKIPYKLTKYGNSKFQNCIRIKEFKPN